MATKKNSKVGTRRSAGAAALTNALAAVPQAPPRISAFQPRQIRETPPSPRVKHERGKSCRELDREAKPFSQDLQLWSNWGINDLATTPDGLLVTPRLFKPTNPYEIAKAIREAEAKHPNATIRALGSGYGFSDASLPQTKKATRFNFKHPDFVAFEKDFGFAIDTTSFAKSLQNNLGDVLKDGESLEGHYFVEAGITIADLNTILDHENPRVALRTMGGTAGQTLAGAASTGTHGADFDRPPLADQIEAFYLVGKGGVHHWIEPKKHITDPKKIHVLFPCIEEKNIHYDDDIFRAVMVSMGAMGVIYACIVKVVPQFSLIGWNRWSSWDRFLKEVGEELKIARDGSWSGIKDFVSQNFKSTKEHTLKNHSLQVVINPIPDENSHDFACYVTNHVSIPLQLTTSGPVPVDLSQISSSDLANAVLNAPEFDNGGSTAGQVLGFLLGGSIPGGGPIGAGLGDAGGGTLGGVLTLLGYQPTGTTLVDQALSLISIAEKKREPWVVRVVVDAILQGAFPLPDKVEKWVLPEGLPRSALRKIRKNPDPGPQIDVGYRVMTGGIIRSKIPAISMEAAFSIEEALLFIANVLIEFTSNIYPEPKGFVGPLPIERRPRYPAGYVSLRICGKTDALLGMQRNDPAAMVEVALIGNPDDTKMIEDIERLALGHVVKRPGPIPTAFFPPQHGALHWGQSNGMMTKADVGRAYSATNISKWKKAQRELGGATFTNEFMRRCGLDD